MRRRIMTITAATLFALSSFSVRAAAREIADLQPARLTFSQSILNDVSFGTYREPFDELQTRPYNMLFSNIGRYPSFSPWPGQEGNYTRYVNALIGNNGTANVDNGADSIQGSIVRRQTDTWSWGVSAAILAGNDGNENSSGASTFRDTDDLNGFDLRPAAAKQLGEKRVLGFGLRLTSANAEVTDSSFESGVGGFFGENQFKQSGILADVGLRTFLTPGSSWEIQLVAGTEGFDQTEIAETIDGLGVITDRTTITNYDVSDLKVGVFGGYNRQKDGALGEMEYRLGIERSQRELDNADLSFVDNSGVVTPVNTLLAQDTIGTTLISASAKSIFQAGETEMFASARLAFGMVDGSTQIDASGFIVNEAIDDSESHLALTLGLRQPFFRDKLRIIVAGRADLVDAERTTTFDTSANVDDFRRSSADYAVGIEGVLANVTFDIAWLVNEEAAVAPVSIGIPGGSRRSVEFDRIVFSAGVAW
ncbi:MAG: hypothetical protein OEV00_01740 [Acidobacteriota bacterium]|nr:hypothetical protein [Acidobacteriota bacterium]MDH3784030.1 hypothetical protein [Acidobacteriota bacterium]